MRQITISTCNLNQWSLDFTGNKDRIISAVVKAKQDGSRLIITPELSLCGYDCLDAFLEQDTTTHSWEVLADIMLHPACQDIIVDVGLPVFHHGCLYNARLVFYQQKILYVRCKMSLANDGLFREMRYFTPWTQTRGIEEYILPKVLRDLTGQREVPIGSLVLEALDCTIAIECCEELFTPDCTSIHLGLQGVDIICNSSASHWQLRKLDRRLDLIRETSRKGGSCYLYSNQIGCEGGGRLYYDGCALICLNGDVKAQASQFSLKEVEVVTAYVKISGPYNTSRLLSTGWMDGILFDCSEILNLAKSANEHRATLTCNRTVDLDEIWQARYMPARRMQAANEPAYHAVKLDVCLTASEIVAPFRQFSTTLEPVLVRPEEEIAQGAGCWVWDYLRRSKQAGLFLPLSGGIDSCATAMIVYSTARLVYKALAAGDQQVLIDVRRIAGESSSWIPQSPQEICNKVLHTCFMGSMNSSRETRERAKQLAEAIGSYHLDVNIDPIFHAFTEVDSKALGGRKLRFESQGGTSQESLGLQNIQSRSRLVLAYQLASTITLARNRPGGGTLLVLGSANVDECLRGYYTKYDNSSADLNPIGSISKNDLKRWIRYAKDTYNIPVLEEFVVAMPSAELVPPDDKGHIQSDERDMGCTYDELADFGKLRKVEKLGPYSMWQRLVSSWADKKNPNGELMSPADVYRKVRHMWYYFGINRHKMETITPALHAETYSPDSNRYDLLPFLRPNFTWVWSKIEAEIENWAKSRGG